MQYTTIRVKKETFNCGAAPHHLDAVAGDHDEQKDAGEHGREAAARASERASSAVTYSFALPRTPSVPKRAVIRVSPSRRPSSTDAEHGRPERERIDDLPARCELEMIGKGVTVRYPTAEDERGECRSEIEVGDPESCP